MRTQQSTPVFIGDRPVGFGHPCFFIAEAGVNHNGDPALAHKLIEVAAEAGADAIKFQTFSADRLASAGAPVAEYQKRSTRESEDQRDMLRRLELSAELHRELKEASERLGLVFLSTPFDEISADLLESLDVFAYKLGSGEVTNLPLIAHVAAKKKPVILSTGMATLAEVDVAMALLRRLKSAGVILLHCVSNYPAAVEDVNLRAVETLASAFGVPVGYSDHTVGSEIAIASVARGACVIEKHFTLDKTLPGPDHSASIEPDELTSLIRAVRAVEASLGHGRKEPVEAEMATRRVARRSLHLRHPLPAGAVLTEADLIALRPEGGISPAEIERVVGRPIAARLDAGAQLEWAALGRPGGAQ